jgi:hypothetical protein
VNDDDLLGDFGDDFNILEFADALDANDSGKVDPLSYNNTVLDERSVRFVFYFNRNTL